MVYILARESRNKGEEPEIQQKVVPYARGTPGGHWVRCKKMAWDMQKHGKVAQDVWECSTTWG